MILILYGWSLNLIHVNLLIEYRSICTYSLSHSSSFGLPSYKISSTLFMCSLMDWFYVDSSLIVLRNYHKLKTLQCVTHGLEYCIAYYFLPGYFKSVEKFVKNTEGQLEFETEDAFHYTPLLISAKAGIANIDTINILIDCGGRSMTQLPC